MGAPSLETLMRERIDGADLRLPLAVAAGFT